MRIGARYLRNTRNRIASTNLLYKLESNVEASGFVIWRKEINHSNSAKRWILRKEGAGKLPDIDFERLRGDDLPAKVS
jgi:hypothetical protein